MENTKKQKAAGQNKANTSENGQGLSERDLQTVRFLEWIKEYSGWWYLICTPDEEHMNLDMMKSLIERLAKEQFYEIIFVLIMVHRNEKFMDNVFKITLLEFILSGWKGQVKDKNRFIKDMAELLI